ncbi:Histone deacetylase 8 [Clydaea vesicula]|uniref:histone deacetylase n=1 Tax=Clydaea vesicula TaxID=447962 RepID=A0AAD5U006_9FUNG|nr:Histone deacetylase 8 [Clydaea vesicula]
MSCKIPLIFYAIDKKYLNTLDLLPSNLQRSTMVHSLIEAYNIFPRVNIPGNIPLATREQLTSDCAVFEKITEYCRYVVGATILCAKKLTSRECDISINFDGGRHHSKKDSAAGYCYVNDIVLGILELHEKFNKVLYIDLDIHHGDGVEEAFKYTNKVFTLSFHRFDAAFYPGSGSLDDVGLGKGKFHNLNIPLKKGLKSELFLKLFKIILEKVMLKYNPDAIVLQCGADGIAFDPLGHSDKKPSSEGWNLDVTVFGGGGYNNENTARSWTYTLLKLLELEKATVSNFPLDDNIFHNNHKESQYEWFLQQEKLKDYNIIPEHKYFEYYGPDFSLIVDTSNMKDDNEKLLSRKFQVKKLESTGDLLKLNEKNIKYCEYIISACLKKLEFLTTPLST